MTSHSDVSPPPLKRRRVASIEQPETSTRPLAEESQSKVHHNGARQALRVFSWNVNGITAFLPPSTPKITSFLKSPPKASKAPSQPSIRACLRKWSWPHIVCLQEVKIAPNNTQAQAAVRRVVNSPLESEKDVPLAQERLYNTQFCVPRDKFNATGFGGKVHGVCMLVRQDLEDTHVRTVDWDLEGRVIICEMTNDLLAIINVYAVNGTTYDYRDPETGKVTGTRHDRKRAFHTLLANEVQSYESRGWDAVVIGDINISRSKQDSFPQLRMGEEHVKNRADFNKKFIQDLGMIDTFRHLKGDMKKYTYRPTHKPWGEGGDRVDMCLITKGLAAGLEDADILDTEDDREPSDHVPLYIQLSAVSEDIQEATEE